MSFASLLAKTYNTTTTTHPNNNKMPFLSRGTPEPSWEVVDHQQVAPVPAYYDAGVTITSISPEDISQTFIFDAPSSSSGSSSLKQRHACPLSGSEKKPKKGLRLFSSKRSRTAPCDSSESDYSSSDEHEHEHDSASSASSSSSSSSSSYSPARLSFTSERDALADHLTMRDALISAREQLLHSSAVRKTGANVFFFEGWSVTRLRKGTHYRLQVKYTARPARAVPASPKQSLPINRPPFMDILDEFWY